MTNLKKVLRAARKHRGLLTILCVLALASPCGTASASNDAVHRFDGTYRGNGNPIMGWGYVCGTSELQSLMVADGKFYYPFHVNPLTTKTVPIKIAADGSFMAYVEYATGGESSDYMPGSLTISGRVDGQILQGIARNMYCSREITLRRN
jgi:hypothetical protein